MFTNSEENANHFQLSEIIKQRRENTMPVVLIATDRTWTSVNATELNDHILNDGIFEGPTFITRDEFGIPPDETFLYKSLNVHLVRDQTYSTNLKVATVLSRFVSHGYRIVSSAGSGVGTSGKARYSADVAVTDYRWLWTLVRDDMAPPPYPSISSSSSSSTSTNNMPITQTREQKPNYSSIDNCTMNGGDYGNANGGGGGASGIGSSRK